MNNKTVLNPLLCCPAVASQSCISQFEYLQEWNLHCQQKVILTNPARQPQKSVPPTPAVAPHSGQAEANLQTLPRRKQLAPVSNKNPRQSMPNTRFNLWGPHSCSWFCVHQDWSWDVQIDTMGRNVRYTTAIRNLQSKSSQIALTDHL